jgi:hypothetical protein
VYDEDMDRKHDQASTAQAVSEAVNGLCLFLCGPSFESLEADAPALLRQWDAEYAPILRMLALPRGRGSSVALGAALARISAIAKAGFDPAKQGQLGPLRAAVRDALTAMAIPLPVLTPEGAAVCELHGPECPVLASRAR